MFKSTRPHEIDHHTLKFIVGVIAISLANLTAIFSPHPLESISASYYEGGWARDIFVGFLFAISAFLMAYNGNDRVEMLLSKIASIAAAGVALVPCACDRPPGPFAQLHPIAAAVMFIILAVFCLKFCKRAWNKPSPKGTWRAVIYAACCLVIVGAMAILAIDHLSGGDISDAVPRLAFYGERAGLMAFGIAWLVASHALPVIFDEEERVPLTEARPDQVTMRRAKMPSRSAADTPPASWQFIRNPIPLKPAGARSADRAAMR